jgi:DNA-binding FadR family transcriptional regulator
VVRPRRLWNVFDSDVITWHHLEGKSDKIFKDLVELRQLIEPGAARLAAARATLADLERIERAAKAMAAAVGDPAQYCEADVEFHFAVVAASDNLLFTSFANLVSDFLRLSFELQQNALNDSDNRIEDDAANHLRVYQAICDGDGEAAHEAMLRVVMDGKRSLVRAMAASR